MKTTAFKTAKLDLAFVAVALIYVLFGGLVFPLIRRFFEQVGGALPPPVQVAYTQFQAIAQHPVITLGVFAASYALLLGFANARINAAVNAALLFYFAFLLLALGLPIANMGV